jgi:hypothetical protein
MCAQLPTVCDLFPVLAVATNTNATAVADPGTRNAQPVAVAVTVQSVMRQPVSGQVLASDQDAGGTLTYKIVLAPELGAVSLNAETGAFTYSPSPDYQTTDSFRFVATDGLIDSNAARVTVALGGSPSCVRTCMQLL